MEHLFGELGLSVFTIFIEIAVGIIFFEVFYNFKNGHMNRKAITVAFLCAILGSFASLMHLGYPLHVYYSIVNLETSWLSREIFCVSGFTFIVLAYLLTSLNNNEMIIKTFAFLSALTGFITLYVMSNVYIYSSVPFWQDSYTYTEYYASAIALGAIFYSLLSNFKYSSKDYVLLGCIAVISAGILAISYVFHGLSLANGNMVIQKSAQILFSYKSMMVFIWILGALSMFFYYSKHLFKFFGYFSTNNQIALSTATLSAILLSIAALLAKLIFYLSMQTSAIGLQ